MVSGKNMVGKRKKESDNTKPPKKPPNAFILYCGDFRKTTQEQLPSYDNKAITSVLGNRWHKLPEEEQAKYKDIAKKVSCCCK